MEPRQSQRVIKRLRRKTPKTNIETQVEKVIQSKPLKPEEVKDEDVDDLEKEMTELTMGVAPSISVTKMTNEFTHTSKSATSTQKQYIYKLPSILSKDDTTTIQDGKKLFVCLYSIHLNGMLPFLSYLMYKMPKVNDNEGNAEDDGKPKQREIMFFPYIRYDTKKDTSLFTKSNLLCNRILNDLKKQNKYDDFEYSYEMNGYLDRPEGVYVFYRVLNIDNEVVNISRNDLYWWVLIDEIVNVRHCVNFPIFEPITYLFSHYKHLLYLYEIQYNDETGEKLETIVEIPTSAYHGTHISILPKIASLGLNPSTIYSMMGPYYYFGTYRKAVRYAGWTSTYKPREINGVILGDSEGRYDNGGIVRFAIFLGKMRVLLNHPEEPDDYSDLVKERMADPTYNKQWEMKTLKLHDHDGKWAEYFDSVYVGKAKLANGKNFMNNPEYIVKTYQQQTPLSYHELDMTTLKNKWDNDYEYYYIV